MAWRIIFTLGIAFLRTTRSFIQCPIFSARTTSLHARSNEPIPSLAWELAFNELVKFKDHHGHCIVPNSFTYARDQSSSELVKSGKKKPVLLGRWVERQRAAWMKGTLGETKFERLEELGFSWDPFQEEWDERYRLLEAFHAAEGHCNVPQNLDVVVVIDDDFSTPLNGEDGGSVQISGDENVFVVDEEPSGNPAAAPRGGDESAREPVGGSAVVVRLGHWVATQRVNFHKGRLNEERHARLDELGFVWDGSSMNRDPFPPRRMVLSMHRSPS